MALTFNSFFDSSYGSREESARMHRAYTLQYMNERANPERYNLMVDLMFLCAAQDDIGYHEGPYYFEYAFQGIHHYPNNGSSFRSMINPRYEGDGTYFEGYLPGSDEHIRTLVNDSIDAVDRVANGRRLFGETAFLSLCVHYYHPDRLEQLIRRSPYQVPDAANSAFPNPEGY